MGFINSFAEKHPKAAEWIRKGGLFVIISWLVTAFKALLLMFLPNAYRGVVGDAEWIWPNIPVTLFGVPFNLGIIGNALKDGGLAYTLGNLTTIFIGEAINFPLQRNVTFKSKGPVLPQVGMHILATIAVFLVMNLFSCAWIPICDTLMPDTIRELVKSIVMTVVTGGVAMIIIFAVDNKIFAPGWGKKM